MRYKIFFVLNFLSFFAYAQESIPASIYDFKIAANHGGVIDFSQYKGKKILIVNTTSRDEYNHQYADLEATYVKYKDKLVVIGFLTEDFLIAPGSKKNVFTGNKVYGVSFPLAAKVLIRGDNMSPVYKWLTEQRYNKYKDTEVKWDFQKYLVNEKGELVAEFDSKIMSSNPVIVAAIEK